MSDNNQPVQLTKPQLAILKLVYRAASNAEIAEQLGISARTVHSHLCNMYAVFGLKSLGHSNVKRFKMVWLARKMGLKL
jgi:DNA-binding NarL/FixJ family response regulator